MSFFLSFDFANVYSEGSLTEASPLERLADAITGATAVSTAIEDKEEADAQAEQAELVSALTSLRCEATASSAAGAAESKAPESTACVEAQLPPAERKTQFWKQKSNSTSSVYLKSTVAKPDNGQILRAISELFQAMIVSCERPKSDPFIKCLPKRARARLCSVRGLQEPPSVEAISAFTKSVFAIAKWSPECNVIALVILARLTSSPAETGAINDRNWDMVLLCAFMLSQKLWDDVALTNRDIPELWSRTMSAKADFDIRAVNRVERLFLQKLHYDIHVDRTAYTEAYFELYSLDGQPVSRSSGPISDRTAAALEVSSRRAQLQLDEARESFAARAVGRVHVAGAGAGTGVAKSATVALEGHYCQERCSQHTGAGGRLVLD